MQHAHSFKKGQKRPPGAGRKKGTPNRTTIQVRDAILKAFNGAGGQKAFNQWAKENRTEFYKLYARLLPKNIQILDDMGNPTNPDGAREALAAALGRIADSVKAKEGKS